MKFMAIPTWIIVRLLEPFLPSSHPWSGVKFSLQDWFDGETRFSRFADIYIWTVSTGLIAMIMDAHK